MHCYLGVQTIDFPLRDEVAHLYNVNQKFRKRMEHVMSAPVERKQPKHCSTGTNFLIIGATTTSNNELVSVLVIGNNYSFTSTMNQSALFHFLSHFCQQKCRRVVHQAPNDTKCDNKLMYISNQQRQFYRSRYK